jgi:DNA repair photolyase
MQIGITERGDAALDTSWLTWVVDKPAILITKNPIKLYNILKKQSLPKLNIIAHCTITGFGGTILEPNVPEFNKMLEGFEALVHFLGKDRVVLRVDPVIPTETGIDTAKRVIETARWLVQTRVRISFIDYYDHVKKRFRELDISLPWDSFHAPLSDRKYAWEQLGKPEVCAEPDFECCGCLSAKDCEILKVEPFQYEKGQRPLCACLANKKELLDTKARCAHACIYFYWKG